MYAFSFIGVEDVVVGAVRVDFRPMLNIDKFRVKDVFGL